MSDRLTKLLAAFLLALMLGLAFFSMRGDSGTFDEVAHLPAGYSYITQKDMRLNPEHPPLVKDLAGLSVLVWSKITDTKITVPTDIKAWTDDVNGQWDFGNAFLYNSGNPAESIFFFGRLPMLLILLVLGIFIFIWTRQLFGNSAALLALFLFCLSPTFIAHGRYITTDVAAATGFFIATYYFICWLKKPSVWNLICATIFFGLAQLIKFSLFLLIPFFGLLTIIWIALKIYNKYSLVKNKTIRYAELQHEAKEPSAKIIFRFLGGLAIIFAIAYIFVVVPVYSYHVANYPPQKQASDITAILNTSGGAPNGQIFDSCKNIEYIKRCPREISIWLAQRSIPERAFSQYLYGLLMMLQRAEGGNTTYFLGQISAAGWSVYFPIMYLLKEPLSLHILTLIALIIAGSSLFSPYGRSPERRKGKLGGIFSWLNLNFEIVAMILLIAIYWYSSIRSPLNIGVRHVLPTFVFIYVLVASAIAKWLNPRRTPPPFQGGGREGVIKLLKYTLIVILLAWQAITIFAIYPSFLAYYNEIIGGSKNGYKVATDSNLDWGQDLRRLAIWTEKNKIDKIYIDYFGGGPPKRYLGDKFLPWWGEKNPADLKSGDWLAISANSLQGGRAEAINNYDKPTDYYRWLDKYEPVTMIGYSIFVYQIPK